MNQGGWGARPPTDPALLSTLRPPGKAAAWTEPEVLESAGRPCCPLWGPSPHCCRRRWASAGSCTHCHPARPSSQAWGQAAGGQWAGGPGMERPLGGRWAQRACGVTADDLPVPTPARACAAPHGARPGPAHSQEGSAFCPPSTLGCATGDGQCRCPSQGCCSGCRTEPLSETRSCLLPREAQTQSSRVSAQTPGRVQIWGHSAAHHGPLGEKAEVVGG